MKKSKLLMALRVAIRALESNSVKYNWNEGSSCNAGIVASAIISDLKGVMKREIRCTYDDWTSFIQGNCSVSGESMSKLVNALKEVGMEPADVCELEYLSNKEIRRMAGIRVHIFNRNTFYKEKKNVVKYLKAWTQILEIEIINDRSKRKALESQLLINIKNEDFYKCSELQKEILKMDSHE